MLDTFLSMDPVLLLSFMGAGLLLNLTPGADVMFAMASGLSGGWRHGVAAAVGISFGSLWHITLATLGVSAALALVPQALDLIRYAGAAYLLWLAWKSWSAQPPDPAHAAQSWQRAVLRGFVTNALNPKVALFVLAFLPQFTRAEAGPIWQQIVILGAIFTTTGVIITSFYGALAGLLGERIRASHRVLNRITAIIFAGLAARLVSN